MKTLIQLQAPIAAVAAVAAALTMAPPARAQQQGQGSTTVGAEIAARGTPNGAAACVGCHGAQGEGNAAGGFPRIAGQPAAYLARQLTAYADGHRNNPVMAPIAKALNRDQIQAVASYFAGLTAPASQGAAGQGGKPGDKPTAKALQRGRVLASTGDNKKEVQACANCHGPGGSGMPPTYPYLAGQHRNFLVAAMNQWRSDARKTDPSGQMWSIARRLDDADIAAVAAFFSAQPPPRPESARIVVPPTAPPPAPTAGSQTPSTQGLGVNQGAATTGGSQSPGGGGGTQPGNVPR